jgi:hypothetical protein
MTKNNWESQLASIAAANDFDPSVKGLWTGEMASLQLRLPRVTLALEAIRAWHDAHASELPLGFSVFYNTPAVIQPNAGMLIIGMNPGGNGPGRSYVSAHKNDWVSDKHKSTTAWQHLFKGVFGDAWRAVLEVSPTTNFCAFRTPHESELPEWAYELSRGLWHSYLLPALTPRRLFICSKTASYHLTPAITKLYGRCLGRESLPVGEHNGTVEIWTHLRGSVVVAPHPSRWTVNNLDTLARMRDVLLG